MTFLISGGYVIGVDLGGSNLRAGLSDTAGAAVAELAEPTIAGNAGAVVAQLAELGRRLAHAAGVEWEEIDGVDDFVFIAVGTGVGMGIVSGGRLVRGAHGAAGEIGSIPVDGATLEEVAGGAGVARRYAKLTKRAELMTAANVYAAAEAGDPAAVEVLDEQSAAVGLAVVAVHSILDPELIVLGGGIGSRDDFADRVRRHVERLPSAPVRLEHSALGDAAGVIGAAEAARRHVREQVDA